MQPVDRQDVAAVLLDGDLDTRALYNVDGPNLRIDGRVGFSTATNY